MSLVEAAEYFHVAEVSVRNWIKSGEIRLYSGGKVKVDEVASFLRRSGKLNARANKMHMPAHDHLLLTQKLKENFEKLSGGELSDMYEASLSEAYKNRHGVYYTPEEVIVELWKGVSFDKQMTFLDPSCGTGNFLLAAVDAGIHPANIHAYDVDENAVRIARKRLYEKTGYRSANIKTGNFIEEFPVLQKKGMRFDRIFTNPPWGAKLTKSEQKKVADYLPEATGRDTSALFFFAALNLLRSGGQLGFLVQEALFYTGAFAGFRKRLLEYQITRLTNHGKVFGGLMTGAVSFVMKKSLKRNNQEVTCFSEGEKYVRRQDSFKKNPKHIINIRTRPEEQRIIEYLYSLPHVRLENHADWGLGIVTGNNKKYISNQKKKGYIPVYKGKDILPGEIRPATQFIPSDMRLYQQVAPQELYRAKEKIIYRFIATHPVCFVDTRQRYVLNSANILIPRSSLGINARQLADILNSKLMAWLYERLFAARKILRSDLEALPLHTGFFEKNTHFNEQKYLEYLGLKFDQTAGYKIQSPVRL